MKIHDVVVYGDLGDYGAHFTHTLNTKTGDLDKPTWDQVRVGMLCMTADHFEDIMTEQDQLCLKYKACNYEVLQAAYDRLYERVYPLAERAKQARKEFKAYQLQRGFQVVEPEQPFKEQ